MTAHAMKGDRERCLAAGMDEYLTKPLDPRQLCQLVEQMAAGPTPAAVPDATPRGDFAAGARARRRRSRAARRDQPSVCRRCAATSRADPAGARRARRRCAARAAHGLKGAAANFDADGVVSAARTLEEIGRAQQFDDGPPARNGVARAVAGNRSADRRAQNAEHLTAQLIPALITSAHARGTTPAAHLRPRSQKRQEELMWNKDEVRREDRSGQGQVKESVGEMTNDEQLRNEGIDDQAAGEVRKHLARAVVKSAKPSRTSARKSANNTHRRAGSRSAARRVSVFRGGRDMTRTATGLCVATAFGCIATLAAQTPPPAGQPTTTDRQGPGSDHHRLSSQGR